MGRKKKDTITINGVDYVPASSSQMAKTKKGMEYVIVRTYSAGVFAGYLKRRDGKEVELLDVRRLWYWSGASSLSQLTVEGVKNPADCKFPCEVSSVILTEAIEILPVTKEAQESIVNVPIWKQ